MSRGSPAVKPLCTRRQCLASTARPPGTVAGVDDDPGGTRRARSSPRCTLKRLVGRDRSQLLVRCVAQDAVVRAAAHASRSEFPGRPWRGSTHLTTVPPQSAAGRWFQAPQTRPACARPSAVVALPPCSEAETMDRLSASARSGHVAVAAPHSQLTPLRPGRLRSSPRPSSAHRELAPLLHLGAGASTSA